VFKTSNGGRIRPRGLFFAQFAALNKETTPPHTLRPGHASSPQSLLLLQLALGWLLCFLTKLQPPKAEVPSISLFFDGCRFGTQNKGTESIQSAPNALHQQWTHSYPWRKELGAWRKFPWRLRATSYWTGGWQQPILLCVVCCVLCQFCWFFQC
jgi:hypothetical protein